MKFLPVLLISLSLLSSCSPPDSAATGAVSPTITPRDVENALEAFGVDLGRVVAVSEAIEDDARTQARRVLEDPSFQELIQRHAAVIEAMAVELRAMTPEERAGFSAKIQPALRSIELRMEAVCSSGPAAQDAFAPAFVAIQKSLRGSL